MAHGGPPHPGVLQLGDQLLVQFVAKVFDAGRLVVQHHGGSVVRDLALGLQKQNTQKIMQMISTIQKSLLFF